MAQLAILAVMAVMALNKGAQERKMKYQASQGVRDAAMRRGAAATAEAGENKIIKERFESRAVALAAFQGGGVDDPSVQKVIGDLNAEGEYRILSKLYVGMSEVEGMHFQSGQLMREGEAALNEGYVNAAKTVMSAYMGGGMGGMMGAAGSSFASFGGAVKANTWGRFTHGGRAAGANLGTMDYSPNLSGGASGVRYG